MKKQILATTLLLFTFVQSCNFGNTSNNINKNDLMTPADYKITNKKEPEKLTFSTKATIQGLANVFKLPEGKNTKIELTTEKVEKDDDKEKIKIPKVGEFKVIFKKGAKYKVLDNNANDGVAVIEMPEAVMEGFLRLTDEGESKSINKITMEDKLYYTKQELSVLSPKNGNEDKFKTKDSKENEKKESDKKESENEKDKWYKIGKKPFPVPTEWYSDNGNDYVLSFNNNGIKKLEFRWFKSDKADFSSGINEITPEAGGVVELAGVGKMEVPAGAVTTKTVMVMKQETQVNEILDTNFNRFSDFISPVIKIEPMNLKLNKDALIYLQTNQERLGNNHPKLINTFSSNNKENWEGLFYTNIDRDNSLWTINEGAYTSNLGYFSKQVPSSVLPNSGMIPLFKSNLNSQNTFSLKNTFPPLRKSSFEVWGPNPLIPVSLVLSQPEIDEVYSRAEEAYIYFNEVSGLDPAIKKPNGVINIFIGLLSETPITVFSSFTNSLYLDIPKTLYGIEHEVWHIFQFFYFTSKNKTDKIDDLMGQNNWIWEASAEHMGARVFRNKSHGYANSTQMRDDYLKWLDFGLANKDRNFPYTTVYGDDKGYSNVGFFTYLGNEFTNMGGDSVMIDILENMNPYFKYFHNYALHVYLQDRMDIYPVILNRNELVIVKENSSTNPLLKKITLENNSFQYYNIISHTILSSTLGVSIRETSGNPLCSNNTTIKAIKDSSSSNIIDLPLSSMIPNSKATRFKYFDNFKNSFGRLGLVISNSNGKNENIYKCNYEIKVAVRDAVCK